MPLPTRTRCVGTRRALSALAVIVPVAAAVLSCAGTASAAAVARTAECSTADLSACEGTDAPADPSLLRYCGPDGRCTPLAHHRAPRHRVVSAAAVSDPSTAG